MNKVVAKLYALCIGTRPADFSERLEKVADELAAEVERQENLLSDPFIRGYLERFHSNGRAEP
ncbi:MAG TPA: hypothetical protein VIV60_21725 [Polyangiaceae bacterium]